MQRKSENLEMLAVVAKGLRGLKEKVVFVGGATIDLYIADPGAPEARATDDVDCVVELGSRTQYYDLEEKLRKLGFKHPIGTPGPICRWDFLGIVVDVMPTEGQVLGFNNRWYAEGMKNSETATLHDGQLVSVFSLPYLLASKVEAFLDRGKDDFLGSRDLEDILSVMDGAAEVEARILKAPAGVRDYLKQAFQTFLDNPRFGESVIGHVRSAEGGTARAERVLSLLKTIAKS